MIYLFYKKYSNKLTTISLLVNAILLIAKPNVKLLSSLT